MAARLSLLEAELEIVEGTSQSLSPELLEGIARFRHKVFIETLGWDLATKAGMELDQFDRADTIYVAARGEDGRLAGAARLLPTNRPYLLAEVFPELMGGAQPPHSADVWELSRFAAVDFDGARVHPLRQFSSPVTVGLLREVLRVAASHGVSRLITVSPLGVERLLRRLGVAAHRAAPPLVVDGQALFACWIEVQGSLSS
ncbi:Acyl-homoserine-lactone synthase [Delftia sp. Cs1-4]|uniref:acyl-homoserine-lactone synthase n=1 Tax=Delftia sp. (strain Cs1-4) TaxID=742013 RepID=UPI00020E7AED|nr:acyl-homoserine-lactone synthase [Delftia sp. Cs1-4]AEF88763.1 Acyl-homoserine-lactone synthase [Delftia sp. Cs1-4]